MTKGQALHAWFNHAIPLEDGGYLPFYTRTSVPDDAVFPWGTYELITSAWEEGEVGLTVDLWFHTDSEAIPNEAASKLSQAIGMGGAVIPCDEGYIWLKLGSPWCQSLSDETDEGIKRRYINITAEYMTTY